MRTNDLDQSRRSARLFPRAARRGVGLLLTVALLAGCGEESEPSAPSATTPTQGATRPAPASAPASPSGRDIAPAERAVKHELADIPLWQDARFKGRATSATEVCVDRIVSKESADALGGGRTSHVVVTLPQLDTGEPQDGPCAKAAENADKAIEAARRFYLRADDDAIALEEAVKSMQDGEAGAVERLASVRDRISKRVSNYLLKTGKTSVGGNLLVSAATTAREAARSGDVARLADVRRDIAEARGRLADEAIE